MTASFVDVDARLLELAVLLDEPLRRRLLALVQADSRAARLVQVENDLQRAEDLAQECRRQLASAHRQLDTVRTALEAPGVDVADLRRRMNVRPRPAPAFEASRPFDPDLPGPGLRERVERARALGHG